MKAVEHWVLRIADHDLTWVGFGWLRPAKHDHIGLSYILVSSILLGLPGVAVGAGLIYLVFGRVDLKVLLMLFTLATAVELALHAVFAHYWNRRVRQLKQEST